MLVFVSLVMLLAVACGGGDDDDDSPFGDLNDDSGSEGSGDDDNGDDDGDGNFGSGSGDSYAELTVDGTTIRFTMADITYSPNEAINDVTFETCDPDFFGVGFWVIGYPVDDAGELVLADNKDIDGALEAELPAEGTDPEMLDVDMRLEYGPAGIDLRYSENAGSEASYEIDGNRVSGTITLYTVRNEPAEVEFEIVCDS
jgi:hypothetical protein